MEAEPLDKHDTEQVAFMAEECILVNESDTVTGSASKVACHHGEGVLHRAFSILVFDSEGRLLLQQRSPEKITFPGVWANTCCSHPLHCEPELEMQDALGVKRAAQRKLGQELGIPATDAPLEDMVFMTRMLYRARASADPPVRSDRLPALPAALPSPVHPSPVTPPPIQRPEYSGPLSPSPRRGVLPYARLPDSLSRRESVRVRGTLRLQTGSYVIKPARLRRIEVPG